MSSNDASPCGDMMHLLRKNDVAPLRSAMMRCLPQCAVRHTSFAQRTSLGVAVIICRRQTSFKKRTFVGRQKCVFCWRRERDSNSRYGITAHTISSRSTLERICLNLCKTPDQSDAATPQLGVIRASSASCRSICREIFCANYTFSICSIAFITRIRIRSASFRCLASAVFLIFSYWDSVNLIVTCFKSFSSTDLPPFSHVGCL